MVHRRVTKELEEEKMHFNFFIMYLGPPPLIRTPCIILPIIIVVPPPPQKKTTLRLKQLSSVTFSY